MLTTQEILPHMYCIFWDQRILVIMFVVLACSLVLVNEKTQAHNCQFLAVASATPYL